jgi:hypothetical protein
MSAFEIIIEHFVEVADADLLIGEIGALTTERIHSALLPAREHQILIDDQPFHFGKAAPVIERPIFELGFPQWANARMV